MDLIKCLKNKFSVISRLCNPCQPDIKAPVTPSNTKIGRPALHCQTLYSQTLYSCPHTLYSQTLNSPTRHTTPHNNAIHLHDQYLQENSQTTLREGQKIKRNFAKIFLSFFLLFFVQQKPPQKFLLNFPKNRDTITEKSKIIRHLA